MSMYRRGIVFLAASLSIAGMTLSQVPSFAMGGGTEAIGNVMLPTIKEEIISVELPTVGDESPFDFYIDPQGLLYDTGAVRHGGGVVEEGAYLLFHNHDGGEYDFSRYSDRLRVTNRSTIPVNVKITAEIDDLGDLRMGQDGSFESEDDPAIYLAIADDEGNERVLSEDGVVSVEIEMSSAPPEAYTYRYDESSDSYEYIYQDDEDISFDTYSFGLRGECNSNADWKGVSAYPRVMVTWSVDPIYPDNEGDIEDYDREEEEIEEEPEEDISQTEVEVPEDEAEEDVKDEAEENPEDVSKDSDQSLNVDPDSGSDSYKDPGDGEKADPDKETIADPGDSSDENNTDNHEADAADPKDTPNGNIPGEEESKEQGIEDSEKPVAKENSKEAGSADA